jgi:hypothetical protein
MEMVLLVSLCIITGAFIAQQYSSMRRIERVRVEKNERRDL